MCACVVVCLPELGAWFRAWCDCQNQSWHAALGAWFSAWFSARFSVRLSLHQHVFGRVEVRHGSRTAAHVPVALDHPAVNHWHAFAHQQRPVYKDQLPHRIAAPRQLQVDCTLVRPDP